MKFTGLHKGCGWHISNLTFKCWIDFPLVIAVTVCLLVTINLGYPPSTTVAALMSIVSTATRFMTYIVCLYGDEIVSVPREQCFGCAGNPMLWLKCRWRPECLSYLTTIRLHTIHLAVKENLFFFPMLRRHIVGVEFQATENHAYDTKGDFH